MIRSARPAEAAVLTSLALRAKAHWGYDAAFIEACREERTVTAEQIRLSIVRILDLGGGPVGFYTLAPQSPGQQMELQHLFVEPDHIRRGYGKRLFDDAGQNARALGFAVLMIVSDPFAEGFYRARGAERVGAIRSSVRPARELPVLHFDLCRPPAKTFHP
jgi:GNAT superfamily N-acetyltransferase